jgi:hypothetical protein
MKNAFGRQLMMSLGIIIFSVALAAGAMYYFSSDITKQVNAIITNKSRVARQAEATSILAALKHDAPRAEQYSAAVKKLLPPHDDLLRFRDEWVKSVGRSHKVTATVTLRGDDVPASASAPGSDGFSMSIDGAAGDIAAFLEDIEASTSDFLLSIDSLDVRKSDSGYSVTANGRVFSK